ncbi:MAG: hypothetical protein WC977_11860 [Anaerovoracaceae bacterium]
MRRSITLTPDDDEWVDDRAWRGRTNRSRWLRHVIHFYRDQEQQGKTPKFNAL